MMEGRRQLRSDLPALYSVRDTSRRFLSFSAALDNRLMVILQKYNSEVTSQLRVEQESASLPQAMSRVINAWRKLECRAEYHSYI